MTTYNLDIIDVIDNQIDEIKAQMNEEFRIDDDADLRPHIKKVEKLMTLKDQVEELRKQQNIINEIKGE